jgi:valyl-tRNA synthetase
LTSETVERAEMAPRYNPAETEKRWYDFWEQRGLFRPNPASQATPFVITIPPPNVTGELHMGHALTYGIEDILGRFKRMQGYNTLILPGTDHAGIATQNVVEKQLAAEGLTRYQLGRDTFLERVWQWKEQYADNIRRQFRAMGCAFDWSRERFTMDEGYVDAVLEFFIRLYDDDQIYRGWRVINWCVRCHSAISDIEVEDVEREDRLYYLRYPLRDGSGDIVVATVRPETILGDVAVAVNPEDERYVDLVGKTAVLPLLDRDLPIITDPMVDRNFGTGAVKITPAHDFADFEVGQRHGLPAPIAISPDAVITEVGGPYEGQTVEEARRNVLRDLEAQGYIVKEEPYTHNVPTCERCGTVLEPLLSEQWFMKMEGLARPAMEVVEQGQVRFVPERWTRVYLDWMERIRPWTLSRQLWWGHRIPVYYCANGHAAAAKSWPEACRECGAPVERQDPDVLDTWFSSALWPFATLGWPQHTEDLERYYPTSFMNTSSQILYLWIARMIMTGLRFMGEAPFPVVLINPTILNKHGQRMSKSLGTGIDPLDLVAEYGADALRFGLMTSGSTHQQEVRFSSERVEQARNFANKVWNVTRAVLSHQRSQQDGPLHLLPADRWILSRLNRAVASVTEDLERYEFSGAGLQLQEFIWSELADWYLEMAKLRLYGDVSAEARAVAAAVLWSVLDRVTRLLHPYMPFLTEEIWQHLRSTGSAAARELSGWTGDLPESVMVAPWPSAGDVDQEAEAELDLVMALIRAVRAARSEHKVDPAKFLSATVVAGPAVDRLQANVNLVSRLARLEPLAVYEVLRNKPERAVELLVGDVAVYLPLDELTDLAGERERVTGELAGARQAQQAAEAKLSNQAFLSRAPAEVVRRERDRCQTLTERIRRLEERLRALEA